jgi:hypothetical protein
VRHAENEIAHLLGGNGAGVLLASEPLLQNNFASKLVEAFPVLHGVVYFHGLESDEFQFCEPSVVSSILTCGSTLAKPRRKTVAPLVQAGTCCKANWIFGRASS